MLQKKKSDKRAEDAEAYKQETKASAGLESKQSKESLPDSDADPDADSDAAPNQIGSRSRPKETHHEDKTAPERHTDLKQNAAKLRSTSTSNAKQFQ